MGRRMRRSTRNVYVRKNCPRSYCEAGELQVICSPHQKCPDNRNLPSCWFSLGITMKSYQQYKHFYNVKISCMPVCVLSSYDRRMPTVDQVASVGDMCTWYYSYGRCPEFK